MNVMKSVQRTALPLLLLGFALAVAGCDPDEQGRLMRYEKGIYLGKADTSLDPATQEDLRRRALNQGTL